METFVVNETSENVWFDDMMVRNTSSPIVQETHYDVWGLELAGIGFQYGGFKGNKYLYNGKELIQDAGLQYYDYGARMYDPVIGRFNRIDRFSEKYSSLSPYQYGANNPIRYIDVNGDSLWVSFENNQRLNYNNGTFRNENGSVYSGENDFIAAVQTTLGEMNGTENGRKLLDILSESTNNFTITNSSSSGGERSLSYSSNKNGGGTIQATALMNTDIQSGQKLESLSHELFHGLQHEFGQLSVGNGINNEVGAKLFGKSIGISAGYPISGFGTNTTAGQIYEQAFSNLLFGNDFNDKDYQDALNSFKLGSINNYEGNGIYNKFGINSNLTYPVIKRFFPLIK